MRKKPNRGEKYHFGAEEVTVIEVLRDGQSDAVKVILPDGKMTVVMKTALDLPVVDTKEYEKI